MPRFHCFRGPTGPFVSASSLVAGLWVLAPACLAAQQSGTGLMTVRVTILEPVSPIALADPSVRPVVERDPVTGRLVLRVALASRAPIEASMRAAGSDSTSFSPARSRMRGDSLVQDWRVVLDDLPIGASPAPLEVRFRSVTGLAETTAIAIVPSGARRATNPRPIIVAAQWAPLARRGATH